MCPADFMGTISNLAIIAGCVRSRTYNIERPLSYQGCSGDNPVIGANTPTFGEPRTTSKRVAERLPADTSRAMICTSSCNKRYNLLLYHHNACSLLRRARTRLVKRHYAFLALTRPRKPLQVRLQNMQIVLEISIDNPFLLVAGKLLNENIPFQISIALPFCEFYKGAIWFWAFRPPEHHLIQISVWEPR